MEVITKRTSLQPVPHLREHCFFPSKKFQRLLFLAVLTRSIFIPIEIWTDPMWWQFVGDTLPEMVFASAWTVLVTFFVQLVGVATGTGTNTSPGLVISATVSFLLW
jgi:hypothetical protein